LDKDFIKSWKTVSASVFSKGFFVHLEHSFNTPAGKEKPCLSFYSLLAQSQKVGQRSKFRSFWGLFLSMCTTMSMLTSLHVSLSRLPIIYLCFSNLLWTQPSPTFPFKHFVSCLFAPNVISYLRQLWHLTINSFLQMFENYFNWEKCYSD
jgi:hypothetical protein